MSEQTAMKLLTKQALANKASKRWRAQYFRSRGWFDEKKQQIYQDLSALGESPSPSAVNEIIGNDSWTNNSCNNCGESRGVTIVFRDIASDDEASTPICSVCIAGALQLLAQTI